MMPIVSELVDVFKALGDNNRLRIIKILASNMLDSVCVNDLKKILNLSQPATSQHLKILKNIQILESKKVGNCVYYRINRNKMVEIKKQMDFLFELAFQKCDKFPYSQDEDKL